MGNCYYKKFNIVPGNESVLNSIKISKVRATGSSVFYCKVISSQNNE